MVGALGAVGAQIIESLEERDFPVGTIRYLDKDNCSGEILEFKGKPVIVEELGSSSFDGVDVAFFALESDLSSEFCAVAAAAGAVCIDTSSAWRLDPDVPLVVPEVNPEEIARYRGKRVIASPNSASIQLAVALKPLHDFSAIKRIVASTYQAVSESGTDGMDELRIQSGELLNGRPSDSKVYPKQIAFNCIPHIGAFQENGCSSEELMIVRETCKVFGDPRLRISATSVWVPVFYGHCASVNIETEEKISADKAREILSTAPGLQLCDRPAANVYPVPVEVAGQDLVHVGRIREDDSTENALNLWIVADNLRKGAATNAVQIAEVLIDRYL